MLNFFNQADLYSYFLGPKVDFDSGKVENIDVNRAKDRKFSDIEDKLIRYIKLISNNHKQDKCGTSWLLLRDKCVKWAVNLEIESLKFSNGWISDILRHHGIKRVNLHDEKNYIIEEEYDKVMIPWRK